MMMSHNLSIKSRGVDHEYLGVSQQYWVDLLSAFMSVYWYVHICTYLQQKKLTQKHMSFASPAMGNQVNRNE